MCGLTRSLPCMLTIPSLSGRNFHSPFSSSCSFSFKSVYWCKEESHAYCLKERVGVLFLICNTLAAQLFPPNLILFCNLSLLCKPHTLSKRERIKATSWCLQVNLSDCELCWILDLNFYFIFYFEQKPFRKKMTSHNLFFFFFFFLFKLVELLA